MQRMTKANLEAAFAGESWAHMEYLAYSDKAEREGYSNVACLFQAIAHAGQVHATNHFKVLRMLGNTVVNLEAAIGGETT